MLSAKETAVLGKPAGGIEELVYVIDSTSRVLPNSRRHR